MDSVSTFMARIKQRFMLQAIPRVTRGSVRRAERRIVVLVKTKGIVFVKRFIDRVNKVILYAFKDVFHVLNGVERCLAMIRKKYYTC